MPSKVITIVIQVMFLGMNMFWALLILTHFNPHLAARAKMTLSLAQNIFMPVKITLSFYHCLSFSSKEYDN